MEFDEGGKQSMKWIKDMSAYLCAVLRCCMKNKYKNFSLVVLKHTFYIIKNREKVRISKKKIILLIN